MGRPRDPLEGRGEQAHESAERRHAQDLEPARAMLTDINRIATLAKEDPARQFYSIAHLITEERLRQAFWKLRKDASAGIDGVVHSQYAANVEENIGQLHRRLVEGKYQAQPLRRVYIPKENGKQRPISIPVLEDKLVQSVAVDLLNAIYGLSVGLDKGGGTGWIRRGGLRCILRLNGKGNKTDEEWRNEPGI